MDHRRATPYTYTESNKNSLHSSSINGSNQDSVARYQKNYEHRSEQDTPKGFLTSENPSYWPQPPLIRIRTPGQYPTSPLPPPTSSGISEIMEANNDEKISILAHKVGSLMKVGQDIQANIIKSNDILDPVGTQMTTVSARVNNTLKRLKGLASSGEIKSP